MDRAMDNTILIVEDDPELQEVLALNLQNAGYRTLRAGTIRQAEALLNTTLPQMVLLDWMLPRFDGLAVTRILREDDDPRAPCGRSASRSGPSAAAWSARTSRPGSPRA